MSVKLKKVNWAQSGVTSKIKPCKQLGRIAFVAFPELHLKNDATSRKMHPVLKVKQMSHWTLVGQTIRGLGSQGRITDRGLRP